MTEAVEVVTDYWFDTLGFPVLRAPKAVANIASGYLGNQWHAPHRGRGARLRFRKAPGRDLGNYCE